MIFFNSCHNALLRQKLELSLQGASDAGIEKKELGANTFVLLLSNYSILEPKLKLSEHYFLNESFHKGCLHQVSHENYGLDFYSTSTRKHSQVLYMDGFIEKPIEPGQIAVILQRGQLITNEGIRATFVIYSKPSGFGEKINFRKV